MQKVTFKEYISNYQITSIHNDALMDELGCTYLIDELKDSETCFLIVFANGGYIQLNSDGIFYLYLANFQYADKDWKNIVRHLYDWCDGEYFEAVTTASQTIAEIDALFAEYPREVK